MNTGPRIPRHPSRGKRTLTDDGQAAALYVTARGALSPLQCLRWVQEGDMWQAERKSPWFTLLVYALLIVSTIAGSAIWPWGVAQ